MSSVTLSSMLWRYVRVAFCMIAAAVSGCAVVEPSDGGRYERIKLEPVSSSVSLFEVISNVANRIDDSREQAAALDAHQECRTNAVFDKYHVKRLYLSLRERLENLGAQLVHEKGYVYVTIPTKENQPDTHTLKQFASVVGENNRVHVFIPRQTPFGVVDEHQYLSGIRNKLSELGVGKDHVLILPTKLFQAPESLVANNGVTVKLCYG